MEEDAKEIIEKTYKSLRQKWNLHQNHKLSLPGHMRHLYNLFHTLDMYLNMMKGKRGQVWISHTELAKMIENSMKRNFTIAQFQQLLNVCPKFWLHKWVLIKGKIELMIEVPENAGEILYEDYVDVNGSDDETEPSPLQVQMNEKIMEKRKSVFSEELVATCYDFYAEHYLDGEDDTQSIYKWPSHFDIDSVPEVNERFLKDKPEIKV